MKLDLPYVPRSNAAIGFRVHSGWAAFVVLSLDESEPHVLARGRPHLVENFTYRFRQPYHTAENMPLDEARAFISNVEKEAGRLALEIVRSIRTDLQGQGYELRCFALIRASGKPLLGLEKILSSHALIHTADGELFREALTHAGQCNHLTELSLKESELFNTAYKIFGQTTKSLVPRLTALGKPFGPPWSQDEKFAALAAWLALYTKSQQSREIVPAQSQRE
jgi:hypothetical protein